MKTMTCKQMGGPCDAEIHGATAEEMMANGGKHVEEMAAKDDDQGHKETAQQMEESMQDEEKNKAWTEKFNKDFEETPEDSSEEKAAE